MEIKEIGKRGIIFIFDELKRSQFDCYTNIFIISGDKTNYICDSFMAPSCLEKALTYLDDIYGRKESVLFNSHYDWDHIWGNSLLKGDTIISQILCYENIKKYGQKQKEEFEKFAGEDIELLLPNLLFQDKIFFPEEGIEFFHSPGHTNGSSSCYDSIDKILYVGDNVEFPLPQLSNGDLEKYIKSLENYLNYDFKFLISGHDLFYDKNILEKNREYLINLKNGKNQEFELPLYQEIHKNNVKLIDNFSRS